jgi:hypothetical protein
MNRRLFLRALPAIVAIPAAFAKLQSETAADVDREFLNGYMTVNEIRAAECLPRLNNQCDKIFSRAEIARIFDVPEYLLEHAEPVQNLSLQYSRAIEIDLY